MKFTFAHNNINVLDLDKSLDFYRNENKGMGLYFISYPDGYWIEIMPFREDHEPQ